MLIECRTSEFHSDKFKVGWAQDLVSAHQGTVFDFFWKNSTIQNYE